MDLRAVTTITCSATDSKGATSITTTTASTSTIGVITNFTGVKGRSFAIDGYNYSVNNAGHSWSLTMPVQDTLRFEVRSGDHVFDNTEISWIQGTYAAEGVIIDFNYDLVVESGAAITSPWVVMGEVHANSGSLPSQGQVAPFSVRFEGNDHLKVQGRYWSTGETNSGTTLYLWTDPNPIVRDKTYKLRAQMKFADAGGGFVKFWVNDTQVVNYSGRLGYPSPTYPMFDLYRSQAAETLAVRYSNIYYRTS